MFPCNLPNSTNRSLPNIKYLWQLDISKLMKKDDVKHNADTYARQVYNILDPNYTDVVFNSAWLAKLDLAEIVEIASNFTIPYEPARRDGKRHIRQTVNRIMLP